MLNEGVTPDKISTTVHRPTIAQQEALFMATPMREEIKGCCTGKKYLLRTYGCQMNEHDTEIMAGLLEEMGYAPTQDETAADLILYNTCAVRENAETKVFGEVGRLRPLKNVNPELLIGVCGCMPQEQAVQDKVRKTYPWIDLVFGTHNLHRLPELILTAFHSQETVMEVWDHAEYAVDRLPKVRKETARAWVNIQYGCNKFCTYCVVPYTRGRERSRTMDSIAEEVKELGQQGFKEISLLGQNVNDYGLDANEGDFADLLRLVGHIDGIERVRFTTSNPWNFTDKLIAAIAETQTVCEHIHLPVQSGSDRILQRMNRGYSQDYYLQVVEKIRAAIPGVALTTDIIVGFPGEQEVDFEATLALIEQVQYDTAYTFMYSARIGTPAEHFADSVPDEIKKQRLQRLMEAQNPITRRYNDQMVGQSVDVLIEGPSRRKESVLAGRTRSNKLVLIEAPQAVIGQIVQVKIETAHTWTLYARVL